MTSQAVPVTVAPDRTGWVSIRRSTGPSVLRRHPGVESYIAYLASWPSQAASPAGTGHDVIEAALATDVKGRGGAGFPLGRKLQTVAAAADVVRVVVANGEEGEPGSVKDRVLLRTRPHLVLDGLELAGRAVDASALHVCVSDPAAAAAVELALTQRPHSSTPVTVSTVAPAYVAGEESAVVRFLDGGPALPTAKPPRAYEVGVGGHPTVVSNVETLAHLALAVRHGHQAYDSGSVLVTLSGDRLGPALVEVPHGTRLGDVIGPADVAGVLCGGLFGGLRRPDVLDLALDHAVMREAGTSLGCAAFHVLSSDGCAVELITDAVAYFSRESSHQCGSCFKGTDAMAATLRRLGRGEAEATDLVPLERWSTQLLGRGNCALLDAACGLVGSLFAHWPDEIESHLSGEPCDVCRARAASDDFAHTRLAVPVEPILSDERDEEQR